MLFFSHIERDLFVMRKFSRNERFSHNESDSINRRDSVITVHISAIIFVLSS